ncbi:uncharacterized protein MAM_01402 [Metarhizium album ARSEF 1941]|uniref:Uncharacterized protein n=1 Tax=Metarhizium album (strain ARSEF 1941) TaxID=1081103 RepID=A0A0B2X2T6_METAS|nr:uncharacterized protein MAM_01402 [Metarhizium album ARSEF 1941]KHO00624.1 hypothetical protein MAM_01402 [Metarhizium album ARSEF 1941]
MGNCSAVNGPQGRRPARLATILPDHLGVLLDDLCRGEDHTRGQFGGSRGGRVDEGLMQREGAEDRLCPFVRGEEQPGCQSKSARAKSEDEGEGEGDAVPAGSVARTTLPMPWYSPLGASAFRPEAPYAER